jgi:hypothetical protein
MHALYGDKKAIVAVAHSILVIAYHVLRDGVSYRELGSDYFDRLQAQPLTRYHTQRLAALGYTVTLTKAAALGDPQPHFRRIFFRARHAGTWSARHRAGKSA